ncbi:Putative O-antigen transporter [Megamonas hypermegale]|jgi:PST family polysaccharide transporter|uniref:O-antigen transporter n=1 Tax=Megamonas hypermegale TaxID=158847 RepID=A0A378NUN7_9FIRM|nr:flippase [Megamonas hypermegale]STY72093.1 Putative O-antigen transporter [Megamonas hypermegale]
MLKKYKRLIENIMSLFMIKGLQYILAFITFPYLVRVLQVENFGSVVFVQGILQYFILFTDYGFNLLGPKEIAQNDNKKERGKIFASIFAAKLILLFISTILFVCILVIISYINNEDILLYIVTYLMVIGNVILPVWFFQGIQQMRYITIVNIIGRLFSVVCIFYYVRIPEDYVLAGFFQAIVPLIAGLCSWIILWKNYKEIFILPKYRDIKQVFIDAWEIFTSTVAINLYTASNLVFLGLLTNNIVVGYFSGAQKIIQNINSLISPITQAIYPYISKITNNSKSDALKFLKKMVWILGGGNFIVSILIFIFAEWIVDLLLGDGYEQSVLLLRILSFLPFIISLSNIFGIQTMLVFGMKKQFNKILLSAAVINTIIVLPMIYFYQAIGVSISMTITEMFVTLTMYIVLRKNNIHLISRKY